MIDVPASVLLSLKPNLSDIRRTQQKRRLDNDSGQNREYQARNERNCVLYRLSATGPLLQPADGERKDGRETQDKHGPD